MKRSLTTMKNRKWCYSQRFDRWTCLCQGISDVCWPAKDKSTCWGVGSSDIPCSSLFSTIFPSLTIANTCTKAYIPLVNLFLLIIGQYSQEN